MEDVWLIYATQAMLTQANMVVRLIYVIKAMKSQGNMNACRLCYPSNGQPSKYDCMALLC